MIKVLSPYNLDLPFIAPLSGLTCTKFTLNLFIWNGLKSAVPASPTYQLTKENPSASNGNVQINIAKLVNDFIDYIPNINGNANNQVWVKWNTVYTTTDPNDLSTVTNEGFKLATKGYLYGLDAENSETPTNKILIPDNVDYQMYDNFIVPIEVNEASDATATIISYPNNDLNYTVVTTAQTNSNNLIQNILIELPANSTDTYIDFIYNGVTIFIDIITECKYTPKNIVFLNKEGAIQLLPFFKKSVESIQIESEKFESDNGLPSEGSHQFETYNVQGKSNISVNSGFVSENMNGVFKQLLLSSKIWMLENDILIPLNLSSKSLEYKTRQNDKLINYNLKFDYSFNDILDV